MISNQLWDIIASIASGNKILMHRQTICRLQLKTQLESEIKNGRFPISSHSASLNMKEMKEEISIMLNYF